MNKREKTLLAIIIIVSVLLIASIITNIVLISKENNNNRDNKDNTEEKIEEASNKALIGVYYNAQHGRIEIIDDKKCLYLHENNKECTYTISNNKITFNYYRDVEKDEDGKCYNHYINGDKEEISCIEEHKIEGTLVNNGIILSDSNFLYSKMN